MKHLSFATLSHYPQIHISSFVKANGGHVGHDYKIHYIYTHITTGKTYNSIDELIDAGLAYEHIQTEEYKTSITRQEPNGLYWDVLDMDNKIKAAQQHEISKQEFHEWKQEKAYGEVFEDIIDEDEIDDIDYTRGLIL